MSRPAPAPGAAPRSRPAASATAVVLGIVLLVLGAAAVADAAGTGGARPAASARALLESLDGLTAGAASTAAGVGIAIVGVLLVVAALKTRPRTHVAVGDDDTWLSPRAVATLAAEQAEQHPAVLDARAAGASRRRVGVSIVPRDVEPPSGLAEAVRTDVETHLRATGVRTTSVVVRLEEER